MILFVRCLIHKISIFWIKSENSLLVKRLMRRVWFKKSLA